MVLADKHRKENLACIATPMVNMTILASKESFIPKHTLSVVLLIQYLHLVIEEGQYMIFQDL